MPEEEQKGHNYFLYVIILSCITVIYVSYYIFYIQKDYDFVVETSCDNTQESCRYRDCGIDGECPPNNLSLYNEYTINASDFASCKHDDCTEVCKNESINCVKTECTEDDFTQGSCLAQIPAPIPEPIVTVPTKNTLKSSKLNTKK